MKVHIFNEKDEGKLNLKNKIVVISKSQLKSVFDVKKDKAVIEGLSLRMSLIIESLLFTCWSYKLIEISFPYKH